MILLARNVHEVNLVNRDTGSTADAHSKQLPAPCCSLQSIEVPGGWSICYAGQLYLPSVPNSLSV
jgi:hypothetical protein